MSTESSALLTELMCPTSKLTPPTIDIVWPSFYDKDI